MNPELAYRPGGPLPLPTSGSTDPGAPPHLVALADALVAGGWHVEVSRTHGSSGARSVFFATLFAWRGDWSLHATWVRDRNEGGDPVGRWRAGGVVGLARRHPDQPVEDFGRRYPKQRHPEAEFTVPSVKTAIEVAGMSEPELLAALPDD